MTHTVQLWRPGLVQVASLFEVAENAFDYGSPWTVEQFASLLEQEAVCTLIAHDGDEVSGFLIGRLMGLEAEIYNVAVHSMHKQQGVGSTLIQAFKQTLQLNQINEIFLEVRVSNLPAQTFYKKHGFECLGLRKNYYSNPVEDALILKFER